MNHYPLISICMPVYNAENFLAEALESAFDQSYKNIEVICVDDGSTDSSLDILKRFRAPIQIIESKNYGAPNARNLAFGKASGEYVQFFDADNLLERKKLELQQKAMEEFDVDMVFCNKRILKGSNQKPLSLPSLPSTEDIDPFLYCLRYNLPGGRAAIDTDVPLHRRKLLEKVGGFRVGVARGQDKDLAFRLAGAGATLHYLDEELVIYRDHDGSRISNIPKPAGFHVEYFLDLIKVLISDSKYDITELRRRELAIVLSRFSKESFRQGARDVADKGFSYANELADYIDPNESNAYRIIKRFSGYRGAEIFRAMLYR